MIDKEEMEKLKILEELCNQIITLVGTYYNDNPKERNGMYQSIACKFILASFSNANLDESVSFSVNDLLNALHDISDMIIDNVFIEKEK